MHTDGRWDNKRSALNLAVNLKRIECLQVLLKYNAEFASNDISLKGGELQWYNEQKRRIERETSAITPVDQPKPANAPSQQSGNSQKLETLQHQLQEAQVQLALKDQQLQECQNQIHQRDQTIRELQSRLASESLSNLTLNQEGKCFS
jgi:chromosome segregation ATPase